MIRTILSHDGAIDINSKQTLWSVFLIGVIAPEVFIVQPGFIQGLVEYVGFDDQGAGYTASAEMFGLAATTILMTFIAHRVNWRTVILPADPANVAGLLASHRKAAETLG